MRIPMSLTFVAFLAATQAGSAQAQRTHVIQMDGSAEQEEYSFAPATINLRLAAVRRVAYEAADAGLLSPELAAGIRRVFRERPSSSIPPFSVAVPVARGLLCTVSGTGTGKV